MATMPTPVDRDIIMGPPPVPMQLGHSASGDSRARENQDISDKYRRLKRKYVELEEVRSMSDLRFSRSSEADHRVSAETQGDDD